ncbi:phage tail protein [Variovorax ginsengisoli]|uniref:Phage tail protein n=1 Tax=Variovorax ginsengisoli TaxID=363844 RepID=A0ABT8RZ81_9BURK|nr:phage tail protein [Variovorax ginsengisoli]MDN8612806.1 phage tail protein [Variovorax ginsengisoli]MDO1531976.1 phage tail protein [Variovorax ginsengisoli]
MARTALTVVGGIVGGIFGMPQVGLAVGSLIGNAVDPEMMKGPRIGETGVQTSAEGAPRAIVFATHTVTGNIIQSGRLVKGDVITGGKGGEAKQSNEICIRTYAIRICEGPIGGVLRIWEDDKLVYDVRTGSAMLAESAKWFFGCGIYLGDETQMPDAFLMSQGGPEPFGQAPDTPAYRGTAYMVFVGRDLTDRRGSIPQYRFEVARAITSSNPSGLTVGPEPSTGTYIAADATGVPYLAQNFINGGASGFEVASPGGSYDVAMYPKKFTSLTPTSTATIFNAGNTAGDPRLWPIAFDDQGYAVSYDANFGYCKVVAGGSSVSSLKPTSGASPSWWFGESTFFPEYGGLIFITSNAIYLGVRMTGSGAGTAWDSIYKFSKVGGTLPSASISGITGSSTSPIFWMHVSRAGNVRAIPYNCAGTFNTYDANLALTGTVTLPAAVAARFPGASALNGFGIDETKDMAVYVYGGTTADIYRLSTGVLLTSVGLTGAGTGVITRVVFTDDGIYIQRTRKTYFIGTPATFSGVPMVLGDIVAEIHDRCGVPASKRDVSELTDQVTGLVLAGDYNGGDAIDAARSQYFFDKAEYDKKLWYPKRGKAVAGSITIDDLIEVPDLSRREQAVEFPKKLHLQYQHAASGYPTVKATSQRSSPDVRVVGEVTMQTAFSLNEDQAAQSASKRHKVVWAEAEGELVLSVPDSLIKYVASDVLAVTLRGRTSRERLEKTEHADGVIKWTLRKDRQSAYTSSLTGVPIPPPTLPPPTITGDTVLVVADISGRQDTEDDLNYLVAVSGTLPAWYGALVQRSLDGGASFTDAVSISSAARIGTLLDAIPAASEDITDTTNVVRVQLYRTTQTIDSISNTQFLAEQGAFLLEKADGTHEVMQYRDAVDEGGGIFRLSTLHRGRLNSGAAAHLVGAKFVMLEDMTHVPAQSSWIGQTLTHRGVSFDQAPELAAQQSKTYAGRSQIEWPVASFALSRSGNVVTTTWAPRHRFGSDDAPLASINFQGFRLTFVGTSTVTFDQTAPTSTYDVSAIGGGVTVSVASINRIMGAGPATSGAI